MRKTLHKKLHLKTKTTTTSIVLANGGGVDNKLENNKLMIPPPHTLGVQGGDNGFQQPDKLLHRHLPEISATAGVKETVKMNGDSLSRDQLSTGDYLGGDYVSFPRPQANGRNEGVVKQTHLQVRHACCLNSVYLLPYRSLFSVFGP